jgi:hypothetical protein
MANELASRRQALEVRRGWAAAVGGRRAGARRGAPRAATATGGAAARPPAAAAAALCLPVRPPYRSPLPPYDSLPQTTLGGGGGNAGICGSLRPASMGRVLDAMRRTGLGPASIFVDVGSGSSCALLQALLSPGLSLAWGIELDGVKCQRAATICERVVRAFALVDGGEALAVPSFRNCCISDAGTLHPSTHAYAFWEGFDGVQTWMPVQMR